MIHAAPPFAPFARPAGTAVALAHTLVVPSEAEHSVEEDREVWRDFHGATGQLASLALGSFRLQPGAAPHLPTRIHGR